MSLEREIPVTATCEFYALSGYNRVIRHNGILCQIGVIDSMITQMYALVKKI